MTCSPASTTWASRVFTDTTGAKMRFYDFALSVPSHQRGQLKSYSDPAGNVITLSYDSGGKLQESVRSSTAGGVTVTESLLYAYHASGDNRGAVSSVTLRRKENSGAWATVRTAEYTYYDRYATHGTQWDIKTVVIKDAANAVLDTKYYRYYTDASGFCPMRSTANRTPASSPPAARISTPSPMPTPPLRTALL